MSVTDMPPVDMTSPEHRVELLQEMESILADRYRVEITEIGDVHLTMSPSYRHALLAHNLQVWLMALVGKDMLVMGGSHIATSGFGLREPDMMVIDAAGVPEDTWAAPASQVRLAIEVNSPSNPENDWQTKVDAYAASGIAYYWIVGLDERVTMFTLATDAQGQARYVRAPLERPTVAELVARTELPPGVTL